MPTGQVKVNLELVVDKDLAQNLFNTHSLIQTVKTDEIRLDEAGNSYSRYARPEEIQKKISDPAIDKDFSIPNCHYGSLKTKQNLKSTLDLCDQSKKFQNKLDSIEKQIVFTENFEQFNNLSKEIEKFCKEVAKND